MSIQKVNVLNATSDQPAMTQTTYVTVFKSNTVFVGTLSTQRNTVAAEIFLHLIKGENLAGIDVIYCIGTTPLASGVGYPKKAYGWTIDRVDIDVSTNDSGAAVIHVCFLGLANAFPLNAEAAKRNATRTASKFDPNQCALFPGGDA